MNIIYEIILFLKCRKKLFLLPLVLLLLLLFGLLLIIAESTVVGPFIYTLF